MTNIFVAGEGAGEIGRWVESRERRATSQRTNGVLFELYARRRSDGAAIDGVAWSKVRQLTVLAEEAGADVLLWARDSDHDLTRVRALSETHDELKAAQAATLEIIGGVVEPCLEAWMVGLKALHPTPEELSVPRLKQLAEDNLIGREEEMVAVVRESQLDIKSVPSLERWLAQL